jgi:hypothetical protein
MIKKIIPAILALSISSAFAQQVPVNSQNNAQSIVKKDSAKPVEVSFTQEQISQMNLFLSKADYQNFYTTILSAKVSKESYISYLLSKQHEGIIPIYWLISDYYAKEKNFKETHKWFYISLIATQQDSYLCKDVTARNAPRKLMEFFPESVFVTRATPQYIEDSMREVTFFLTNLKSRIDPTWVCYYGDKPETYGKNLVIEKGYWKSQREKVFQNFVEKYQK